jgi:hypothetical protein
VSQEIFGKGDSDKDGYLSSEEYVRLHREAEDEQGPYDQVHLFPLSHPTSLIFHFGFARRK